MSLYKPDVLRDDVLVDRNDWRDERSPVPPPLELKWEDEEFLVPAVMDVEVVAVAASAAVAVCVVVRRGVVRWLPLIEATAVRAVEEDGSSSQVLCCWSFRTGVVFEAPMVVAL